MKTIIKPLGVQTSTDRFDKDTDRHQHPKFALWRCNLTGLSQNHNLLFVAFSGKIYAYEPQFPSQALPPHPGIIIDTPPSRPGLRGSLDPQNPRAINHLLLQNLGLQEILAVARDDGDVEAYFVAHIVNALERRASGLPVEIRPFFQRNVGLSAWGLAIHTAARVLAASSNTHHVTVFQFGLVGKDEEDGGDGMMRREDVTQVVINGTTNIPCIAFCNTGEDPECSWLLTTDIVGMTRAFDLTGQQNVQTFTFSPSTPDLMHDPINAGWTVLFLDRRSFTHARGIRSSQPDNSHGSASFGHFSEEEQHLAEEVFTSQTTQIAPSNHYSHTLPSPILHASVKNIYLLQTASGSSNVSILALNDPLEHNLADPNLNLDAFERLNMHAYIPSIGILIIASQKGRALVVSLNKLRLPARNGDDEIEYTMKIEASLPLLDQEQGGSARPFAPLAGIAVGPIQGSEVLKEGDGGRRWRLLMMYYDHSVLSYEVERGEEDDDEEEEGFGVRVERVVI